MQLGGVRDSGFAAVSVFGVIAMPGLWVALGSGFWLLHILSLVCFDEHKNRYLLDFETNILCFWVASQRVALLCDQHVGFFN